MSDMIRKTELLRKFEGGGGYLSQDVREIIENEKEAENAVEVIRCNECRFFQQKSEHDELAVCRLKEFVENRDSYCSHAIRRAGDVISRSTVMTNVRKMFCEKNCRMVCDECDIGDLFEIIERQEALNDNE